MQKVSFRGSLNELRKIIEELKSTGAFELSSFNKGVADSEIVEEYSTTLARINAAIEFARQSEGEVERALKNHVRNFPDDKTFANIKIPNKNLFNKVETIEYHELKQYADKEDKAMVIVDKLESASTRYHEIPTTIKKNREMITSLSNFVSLNIPLSELGETENSIAMYGLIPVLQLEKFKSDFDLEKIILGEFDTMDSENIAIVIVAHKNDLPFVEIINNYEFTRLEFNFDKTAKEQIKILENEITKLEREYVYNLVNSLLSGEQIRLLKHYHDFVINELDTEIIIASTIKTKDYYVLNGWIPEGQKKKLLQLIKHVCPNTKAKLGKTVTLDAPPSMVVNSKLIAPYQSVTNMYGPPGKNDLDPNPFVAFFYFVFFGLMIGDIGYGILLFAVTLFIILKIKPSGGARNLIMIICMGAISTILWGIFFGSFFGLGNNEIAILPTPVIDPVNDAMLFLGLALGLGLVHIIAGLSLHFYNLASQRKILDALFDAAFKIWFLAGIIVVIAGMLLDTPTLVTYGMWAVAIMAGLIFLTAGRKKKGIFGKLAGGFGGIYSFVGYFSDVLSYARLFALGLVGAVVAMVANSMAAMMFGSPIGYAIGILVAMIFHTFNIALCLLSAYIHNARLQFVEFFSKFYSGAGTIFTPIGSALVYTRIRSTLDDIVLNENIAVS